MNKEKELIDKLIDLAFAEDIGDGDHTTLCLLYTSLLLPLFLLYMLYIKKAIGRFPVALPL